MKLQETIEKIRPLDENAMECARKHWDSIAHPLHSLGKLEDMVVQIAGEEKVDLGKKALVAMCADNGVVEEGVTQTGQEITALVAENFLCTKAASSIMCKSVGCDIFPIDVGVARGNCHRCQYFKQKNRLWNKEHDQRTCHDQRAGHTGCGNWY